MALTIGRVGSDIALDEHAKWSETGDGRVSIGGWIDAADAADASFLREQLLGLADQFGERIVPVTFGVDDERDGWYEVESIKVDDVLGATEVRGDRQWSATLRRLPYRQQPRYELHRYGTVWTNSHSITTSTYDGFVALPATAEAVDLGSTGFSRVTRASETGSLTFYVSDPTYDNVVSAYVPMGDAYDGAAKIEVDIDGNGTWRTVVGSDIRHLPTRWRINNGIMRASWDTTAQGLEVDLYTGAWNNLGDTSSTDNHWLITDAAASYLADDPLSVTVLRNDPLACTIRLVFDWDTTKGRIMLDVTVRRGDRNVSCILKSRNSETWGIEPDTAASATTALTGGYRVDANDDNGDRWVVSQPKTHTLNTSTGAARLSSASEVFPFAIGAEVNGSSATGQNTAQNVIYQHYAQPTETLFIAKP